MDMDSARGLKSKLIAKLYDGEIQNGNFGLRSEALPVREDAGEQVGIGYSLGETAGDCHLEIRLGRPTGRGAQIADEISAESPSEVNVAVEN